MIEITVTTTYQLVCNDCGRKGKPRTDPYECKKYAAAEGFTVDRDGKREEAWCRDCWKKIMEDETVLIPAGLPEKGSSHPEGSYKIVEGLAEQAERMGIPRSVFKDMAETMRRETGMKPAGLLFDDLEIEAEYE